MHMMLQNEANNKLIISSKSLLSLLTRIRAIIGEFSFHWFAAEITSEAGGGKMQHSIESMGKTAGGSSDRRFVLNNIFARIQRSFL